jgi:hypothetical protein
MVTYEFRVEGDPKCYRDPVRVVFDSYDHARFQPTRYTLVIRAVLENSGTGTDSGCSG